jgi:wobble nucleotide-excising tRNase
MTTHEVWDVVDAIEDLIKSKSDQLFRHDPNTIEARSELAKAIDNLLKNLLVARVDQYTVK